MRNCYKILSIMMVTTITMVTSAANVEAQETRTQMSFQDVARLAGAIPVADVVRRDLPSYCFPALTPSAERLIADAVRGFDPAADPGPIFNHIRQHPCQTAAQPRPDERPPQPRERDRQEARIPAPAQEQTPVDLPIPRYVTHDNRCAVNQPPANARDLRIPRFIEYIYVYLQTHGPAEEAESERLATAMPKAEFVKCFEAFRDLARTRNMRLIITATNAAHRGWWQPEIVFRGRHLVPTNYKSPDEERIFPGAEVPLN